MLFGSETLYLYRLLVVYHACCTCYLYGRLVWCLFNLHFFRCSCPCNSDLVLILLALFDALSMHSDIRIVASHLGTLDVWRMELKGDVGVDPEDGVLMNQPRRWNEWLKCKLGPEMLSSWSNWRPGPRSEGPKDLFLLTLTLCQTQASPGVWPLIWVFNVYYIIIVHLHF